MAGDEQGKNDRNDRHDPEEPSQQPAFSTPDLSSSWKKADSH
jgi:hypothetical protein